MYILMFVKGAHESQPQVIKVYQLLAHGRWFSPDSPASSTTKTGRHDIAVILLKVTLSTINQIKSNQINLMFCSFCRDVVSANKYTFKK